MVDFIGDAQARGEVTPDGLEQIRRISDGVRRRPGQSHVRPGREHGGRDPTDLVHADVAGRNHLKRAFWVIWHDEPVSSLRVRRPMVPAESQAERQVRCRFDAVVEVEPVLGLAKIEVPAVVLVRKVIRQAQKQLGKSTARVRRWPEGGRGPIGGVRGAPIVTALRLLVLPDVVLFLPAPASELDGMFAAVQGHVILERLAGQVLIVHVVRVPAEVHIGVNTRLLRVKRRPSCHAEGVGQAQFGVPVGEVRAGPVVDSGPVHADQQFIEPARGDRPGVGHPHIVSVIIPRARSHAGRGVDGVGEVPAFDGGILPALGVAHREPVLVGEVLVQLGSDGIVVRNIGISGQEVRGNVRIVAVSRKRGQGLQSAGGRIQGPWNLIVGKRLPLERCGVCGGRVVNRDRRIFVTGVYGVTQVAVPHRRRGDKGVDCRGPLVVAQAFVVKKPKRLVTPVVDVGYDDGPAGEGSELIPDEQRHRDVQRVGAQARRAEHGIVTVIFVSAAAQLIRAAACDHDDRGRLVELCV